MSRQNTLGLVVLVALTAGALPSARAQNYTFTNFDAPGGPATTVNGISNTGSAVGFTGNGITNANFLRNPDGTFTALNVGDPVGMANGVNKNGAIVGGANNGAFLLSGGVKTFLPAANPGNTAAEVAFGINDNGAIVGQYTDNILDKVLGFVYQNNTFTILTPTAQSIVVNAQGINNNGLVVGFYSADGVNQHGFIYNTLSASYSLLADPNTARIAADGLVLTQFLGVNDHNQAVGYYQTNNGSQFGFLFDLNTNTYTYLDDPQAAPFGGVQITQITGINNAGEISGFYTDNTGNQRGFIASTVTNNAAPEPGSLLLAAAILPFGALVTSRRRRASVVSTPHA